MGIEQIERIVKDTLELFSSQTLQELIVFAGRESEKNPGEQGFVLRLGNGYLSVQ